MFRNYIKSAIRSLTRQRGYSLLNILGLSVGLTASLLILHWVLDEVNMDGFHQDGDRVYRILSNIDNGDSGIATWEGSPYPLLDYLSENYPEIETVGAFDPTNKKQFKVDGQEFLEDGIFADADFFRALSFPFVDGKSWQVFSEPGAVAISERLAGKLFGSDWKGQVVGETVTINGREYKVSAVFANIPANSSLQFEFALDLDGQHGAGTASTARWGDFDSQIVLKFKQGAAVDKFSEKIAGAVLKNNPDAKGVQLTLQAFERSYLYGQFKNGVEAGGRIEYVRLFGLAAIFLLLIACINFMNLATAKASRRAKEVGVRKTVGAGRFSLIAQFMIEAALITFISIALALLLGELILSHFQEISGKDLAFNYSDPGFWVIIAGVWITTAVLAGSYPAFFLSSFRIANVLKGKLAGSFSGNELRRGLVVFQFALSGFLIIGAFVVQSQVDFIKNKHLGLDKENVLYFRTPPGADENLDAYKSELLRIPGINQVTFASSNPLSIGEQTGDPKWEGMQEGGSLLFHVLITDHNFLKTMNIPMVQGRDFSPLLSMDTMSFLVNETAAKAMHLTEPVGKKLEFWGVKGPIVGVVKDFHISSLHKSIGPLILANMPEETGLTMLRIDPKRTEDIIVASGNIFEKLSEGLPFRYDFLEDRYLQMYRSEKRTGDLSKWFALIALFVSCLGLMGLSAFIAEQKTKEIGIRKVLGASVTGIVGLLSKDFLKLVFIALVIASPAAYFLMENWLTDFAYRIDIQWWVFALAGLVAVGVAFLTVGFQSVKAALANPVESLRSE